MGKRIYSFGKAIFYYIAYSILQVIGMFIYIFAYFVINTSSASDLPIDQVVYNALEQLSQNMTHHTEAALLLANTVVLLVIVLAFRLKKRNIFADLRIRKTNGKNLTAAFVVGLVWSHVLIFFLGFLYDLASSFCYTADYTVVTIASLIIIGPILEEIVYRGIIFNQLNTRMKIVSSAIISALLFAFGHRSSFVHFLLSFLFGMEQVWLYCTTGTLIAPILVHITNNAVADLVLHNRVPSIMLSCVRTVILIGALVYLRYINRGFATCANRHSDPQTQI